MRRLFGSPVGTLWLATGALALIMAVSSCGTSPSAPGTGNLSVYMAFNNGFAAAPAAARTEVQPLSEGESGRTPLSDLIISFDSVIAYACADSDTVMDGEGDAARLQPLSDGEEHDGDDDGDGDCTPFVVLSDSTITLSAAGLDTTLANLLGSAELPAGDYDFLKLGVVQALVVTQAGDSVEAKVPSGMIKVNSPFTIQDGMDTEITIVFDVNRSVVEAPPGSQNFIVKPVLHAQQGWDGHEEDHSGEGSDGDD
jgi:hypothetical protein